MKRVLMQISFIQQPLRYFPNRTATLIFTFVHDFEITSTWRDLTDKGKITLPKNVYILDQNKKPIALLNTNVNIGGFSTKDPIFLRGDRVNVMWGYAFYQNGGQEAAPMFNIFDGYVTEVQSKNTFTLEVMDNMYILQQKQAPVKEWVGYDIEGMMQEMITFAGLDFSVNRTTSTSLGNFRTGNETIAQVLSRLKKDYNFEAYFRGNELRCGAFFYRPTDATTPYPVFTFQQNIISDNLKYVRQDDLTISELACSTIDEETGKTTKDGQAKTKKQRLQVLVTFQQGNPTPIKKIIPAGEHAPDNVEGERKTGIFLQAKTYDELFALAVADLQKFYYEGFRGKFTTFGMPYVKHGDKITLVDNILPERNGTYLVRGVKYTGGIGGLRQEIELDYKLR